MSDKMPVCINHIRIIVQRGDGECIDVGDAPNLDSYALTIGFLAKLNDAVNRCGHYDHHEFRWSQPRLDFQLSTQRSTTE
jgi:hypothetical protein